MAAAEQLERQRAIEPTPERKVALEKSLATLVGMLEEMTPDVEREVQDETEAQEFLAMLEKTYAEAGAKLRAARSQLERAQRDMGRAAQRRVMAERQAEAARQAVGLSHTTNSLNVALKAMQDAAAKDLMAAEAAGAKTRLLKPTQPEEDDPNIVAALAAASGTRPLPQSLSERLAALKAHQV
jgi:chromosome segregation ATPase